MLKSGAVFLLVASAICAAERGRADEQKTAWITGGSAVVVHYIGGTYRFNIMACELQYPFDSTEYGPVPIYERKEYQHSFLHSKLGNCSDLFGGRAFDYSEIKSKLQKTMDLVPEKRVGLWKRKPTHFFLTLFMNETPKVFPEGKVFLADIKLGKDPQTVVFDYRDLIHDLGDSGRGFSGTYRDGSHRVVPMAEFLDTLNKIMTLSAEELVTTLQWDY